MRKQPGQSYESWIEQIKTEELAWAQKEIHQGGSVEQAMELFAARFFQKAMYPLYKMVEAEYRNQYRKNKL